MNSVISAFKTKKNMGQNAMGGEKHDGTGMNSASAKKKTMKTQDNDYQYLRHIREIDTTTKMLSPVVVVEDLLETDALNFGTPCVDVVDHTISAVRLSSLVDCSKASGADSNMNGPKCAAVTVSITPKVPGSCIGNDTFKPALSTFSPNSKTETADSPTKMLDVEDDESEHSSVACTSSSSEHSNSTVVHSPTTEESMRHIKHRPSPVKSLSSILSSNSSSPTSTSMSTPTTVSISSTSSSSLSAPVTVCNHCPSSCISSTDYDVSTMTINSLANVTPAPTLTAKKNSTDFLPSSSLNHCKIASGDNVPLFLKSAPITLPIIMPNGNSGLISVPPSYTLQTDSDDATVNSLATTPKHTRYSKPRLSLSRFINHSMPSVHGRPNLNVPGTTNASVTVANGTKRISTHQRNLSLDFRSMGILLPPVSQITNTRINLTQHHRNRSLDSALQRIPEVEVSSPSADGENTFCTPSILGTAICSKIVTTAVNETASLNTTPTPVLTASVTSSPTASASATPASRLEASVACSAPEAPVEAPVRPSLSFTSGGSSFIDIAETGCPALRNPHKSKSGNTDASTSKILASREPISKIKSIKINSNSSKKREDLASLGSDDSGIICGLESDRVSLNIIRYSHESLDSGEMDAEEECIDMLETTSMDEEYGLIQSDLSFYQSPDIDCCTLRPSRRRGQSHHHAAQQQNPNPESNDDSKSSEELNSRLCFGEANTLQTPLNSDGAHKSIPSDPQAKTISADYVDGSTMSSGVLPPSPAVLVVTPVVAAPGKAQKSTDLITETPKNDVLFKNFFGATKNAIFRTAQSIIENHEKKSAAKNKPDENSSSQDQVKSPLDISKKKEFFGLISSKKSAITAPTANITPSVETPTDVKHAIDVQQKVTENKTKISNFRLHGSSVSASSISTVSKPSTISSLNKLKVPGVVKCFIKERPSADDVAQKTEKGPSGLLRFFESPVFNIHFAVHYLFYSKEPGVLSFIGNKIFSFPDHEVDLYMPQLVVMYIQMDELAEVLDPYLTIRCRKSVDFSLKVLWLLEAFNFQVDLLSNTGRTSNLALMKEIFSKKERKNKNLAKEATAAATADMLPSAKKTHQRSQSDATVLLSGSRTLSITNHLYQEPPYTTQTLPNATFVKLSLGDLTSGRAFENGCTCFETVRGQVNGLLGYKTVCICGAPKTAPQKEFMKALINVGKNLTSLLTKAEKTSALRMFLNLINKNLPARVWLPLYSDIPHHVVRITEEKTAVLNSKDKTPYIIYVEVVEVADIYSSPLIPKKMPSLRHTKSEEHLEGVCLHQPPTTSCSRTSSCSSHSVASNSINRRKKEKSVTESRSTTWDTQSSTGITGSIAPVEIGVTDATPVCCNTTLSLGGLHLPVSEDDVWSQEDDEITAQYLNLRKISERDAMSQMSLDSCDSREQGTPVLFNIGDVRTRHCNNLTCESTKSFSNDPEDPSAAALKEPWHEKEKQIRETSPYGHLANWRLMSVIVKCGDDLRQELMATQLLQMFKIIWQEEKVDLWVRPYKIVCLSNDSGLIEPILNTVSLHQIKKNSSKSLRDYFIDEYGPPGGERFCTAQKNFVQSCAAYCLISYLLQVKDRHNGNILLHSDGHIIHIDFGFILNISPKNLGFEQSPFKLTPEFVDVMGGTASEHWKDFNHLLLVGMMSARKHMDRIINFVEIMRSNSQLPCFKNGCSGTVQNLRKRFHMNLTEQEMERKVEQLVQDSLKSLSTKLYDGYQYYTNGIL